MLHGESSKWLQREDQLDSDGVLSVFVFSSLPFIFFLFIVVQVQLSPSSRHSPTPPPTLDPTPFGFVHVAFIQDPSATGLLVYFRATRFMNGNILTHTEDQSGLLIQWITGVYYSLRNIVSL